MGVAGFGRVGYYLLVMYVWIACLIILVSSGLAIWISWMVSMWYRLDCCFISAKLISAGRIVVPSLVRKWRMSMGGSATQLNMSSGAPRP